MSRLRGPSRTGLYGFAVVTSALAVYYLPRAWVPDWLVWALYLEIAFVAATFFLALRRDRREAEAAREAELRRREAHPLQYSHQPGRVPVE